MSKKKQKLAAESAPKKKKSEAQGSSRKSTATKASRPPGPKLKSHNIHGVSIEVGTGGETHQLASEEIATLTTAQGMPVADNQNSLKAGDRGPVLLEDQVLREKIFRFDHERIPERVVHARGYGARGYFELTDSLKDVSTADVLQRTGDRTDVFARFSTVVGNRGSADLARDARGFAVKFYTREGNWDLVGNNIPVFFIQDAMKFPDLIHAAKQEPDRGFPQAQTAHDNFWDFISLMPEAMHMLMWTMSDRGIPRSFQTMEGFGVHTFRLINSKGKSTYVKYHWKPKAGLQSVTWDEAVKINGADPDYHRRDLWNAIERGDYPEWELGVQLFDDKFADNFDFDILDATKLIPEEQIPVRIIGRMVLDQNVNNFFAETEQVAFCTQNIVPGMDYTNDPLLQGRNFSYLDTQLKRLGSPNFTQIPVNAPKCPMAHFHQDGHMAMENPKGRTNYEPNSRGVNGGAREHREDGFQSATVSVEGDKRRVRAASFADHFSQAGQFIRSLTELEQAHTADAIAFELSKVAESAIRERVVALIVNIDKNLATSVSEKLGWSSTPRAVKPLVKPRSDLQTSDALSIMKSPPSSFAGRTIGVLVADGCDAKALKSIRSAAKNAGALVKLVAKTIDGIVDSSGEDLTIDEKIDGGPSVLFDAVALLMSEDGAESLNNDPAARNYVADAWAHKKYMAYHGPVETLFDKAGVIDWQDDEGVHELEAKRQAATKFLELCKQIRHWDR